MVEAKERQKALEHIVARLVELKTLAESVGDADLAHTLELSLTEARHKADEKPH